MVFVNPLAFWGSLFILVPIAIHLFEFRRVLKVEFSNVSFLKLIESKTSSRNKLQKLLVLLNRIFWILVVVLVFAQPTFTSSADYRASKVFFVDNSLSMQSKNEAYSELLYASTSYLKDFASKAEQGQEFRLVTHNLSTTLYSKDPKSIDQLDAVIFSMKTRPLSTLVDRMDNAGEVFIFSDFQRSGFPTFDVLKEDTAAHYHLIQMGSSDFSNLYVDTVYLREPLGMPTSNLLYVKVKNVGLRDRQDILVKVLKGNEQIGAISKSISANSSDLVEFEFTSLTDLSGSYQVELADPEVVFDNRFFFEIPRAKRSKVAILFEEKRNIFLEGAYGNEALFDLSVSNIKTVPADFFEADLVILNELTVVPTWLTDRLRQSNNVLLIVPALDIAADTYEALLQTKIVRSTDSSQYAFDPTVFKLPFFDQIFNAPDAQAALPEARVFFELNSVDEPLITLRSKAVYLSRKGRVFFLGAPLVDANGNFQKHGLFIPVLYKVALASQVAPPLSYTLESAGITLGRDSLFQTGKTQLVGPDGIYFPAFRNLDNWTWMELPDVLSASGHYALVDESDTLAKLALNLPKSESDLSRYSTEEMNRMIAGYPHLDYVEMDGDTSLVTLDEVVSGGIPLWKYALLLALFLLITEIALLRIFK